VPDFVHLADENGRLGPVRAFPQQKKIPTRHNFVPPAGIKVPVAQPLQLYST
jgi:hypothetical protein